MPTNWETLRWQGDRQVNSSCWIRPACPPSSGRSPAGTSVRVWESIKTLRVRGAPAIGIAAAYGVVLGTQQASSADVHTFLEVLDQVSRYLESSRPTAVNLFWAIRRMRDRAHAIASPEDAARNPRRIAGRGPGDPRGRPPDLSGDWAHGAALLADGMGVLTHCNAGWLATSEFGTALAVIYTAHEQGKRLHVYADETRPLLQGARLTAWELLQRGIETTLICDSVAAQVMREGRVQAVITGADRIAANGDTANKIGTYGVAVLAQAHGIPFYVAAPRSTFDLTLDSGDQIPIEQRDPREVTHGFGQQTAPEGVQVYNPAFDVTPAQLIRAIVTERGVITPVNAAEIAKVLRD